VAKAYLTGIGNGTGDTESLQAFTDRCCCICCFTAAFLDRDSSAYCVSPACIFKTDRLYLLNLIINIQTSVFCYFLSFFNRRNAVLI